MPILTKEVKVKLWGKNIKHYHDLGYDGKYGDIINVKVKDLLTNAKVDIEVICDLCKKNKITVRYDVYNRVIKNTGSYVCKKCSYEKAYQTNQEKYGVLIPSQSKKVKEKIRQTNLNKYGVDNYGKTKECHEKIKQTCIEKYGVEHYSQLQIVKDKREKTNLKRYGVRNASSASYIKEKTRLTNLQKYGVPYTLQSIEVREKILKTLYKNNVQKTSKQQLYLHSILGGKLNFPISYYAIDICFPEEKLALEYDGGGHNLRVVLGQLTQEEFDQKEIIRNNIVKREGYKIIRISSIKDRLPSDQILLQMLQDAKQYFSDYPEHSWIEFNIDASIIRNAEHKKGILYNFGELRTITDKDLSTIYDKDLSVLSDKDIDGINNLTEIA